MKAIYNYTKYNLRPGSAFARPARIASIICFIVLSMVAFMNIPVAARNAVAGQSALSALSWETLELDNGLSAVLSPRDGLPMVSLVLRIGAGSIYDTRGREGLANLTAIMIRQGSLLNDAEAIDNILDSRGASLSVATASEYASFSLTCLSDDFPELLSLLGELLLSPAFDPDEFARMRAEWVERVKRSYGNGASLATEAFYRALWPGGGYGNPGDGYPSSIAAMELEDLLGFYNSFYHPGRAQISVVGPLKSDALLKMLYDAFRNWAAARVEPFKINDLPGETPDVIIVDAPLTQANVRLGSRSISSSNPDFFRLRFVNEVLGGAGMTSRLGDEIRNKRGLAYSVFSWNIGWRDGGGFFIAFSTKVESAREAVDISLAEVEKAIAAAPSEEEMQMTRAGLSGRLYFQLETYSGAAGQIAEARWSGLSRDYFARQIEAAEKTDKTAYLKIAKKYLKPSDFVIVIAGPADKLAPMFSDKKVNVIKPPE